MGGMRGGPGGRKDFGGAGFDGQAPEDFGSQRPEGLEGQKPEGFGGHGGRGNQEFNPGVFESMGESEPEELGGNQATGIFDPESSMQL